MASKASSGRAGAGKAGSGANASRSAAAERAAQLRRKAEKQEKRDGLLGRAVLGLAVLIGVGIIVAGVLISRSESAAAVPPDVTDAGALVLPVEGEADPAITITVIEDYLCPFCKDFEEAAGDRLDEYAAEDGVAVEYVSVNFLDRASSDAYSTRAANAAACVWADDKTAWSDFSASLYANQPAEGGPGLPDSQLVDLAEQAGADRAAVQTCIEEQRHADWVDDVTETATDGGVQGTPTVRVNGEDIESPTVEALEAAVEAARA